MLKLRVMTPALSVHLGSPRGLTPGLPRCSPCVVQAEIKPDGSAARDGRLSVVGGGARGNAWQLCKA